MKHAAKKMMALLLVAMMLASMLPAGALADEPAVEDEIVDVDEIADEGDVTEDGAAEDDVIEDDAAEGDITENDVTEDDAEEEEVCDEDEVADEGETVDEDEQGTVDETVAPASDHENEVAMIADTTLPNANDGVITLTDDVELTAYVSISSDTTVDLNGHTISRSGSGNIFYVTGGTLTITDSAGTGVIQGNSGYEAVWVAGGAAVLKGGTVKGAASDANYGLVRADNNASITVDGAVIDAVQTGIVVFGSASVKVLSGTVKSSGGFGIATNGSKSSADAAITVSGGTISAPADSCGIYLPIGTLVVYNGTITGGAGIVVRGGSANISGGTIKATGSGTVDVGDAGNTVPAAAVVVDFVGGAYGNVSASITGGTFTANTDDAVVYTEKGVKSTEDPSLTVSGGKFSSSVDGAYLSDDLKAEVKDSDGNYGYYTDVESAESAGTDINYTLSALKELVEQAEALNKSDYNAERWSELQIALENARTILNKTDAEQDEINAAYEDVRDHLDALEKLEPDPGEEPGEDDPTDEPEDEPEDDPEDDPEEEPEPERGTVVYNVLIGEKAPKAEIDMTVEALTKAVFSKDEIALIDEGLNGGVLLSVEDATDTVSAADKAKAESSAKALSYTIGQYLNVELYKLLDGDDDVTPVTQTEQPVRITFTIPEAMRANGRTFAVLRIHDGAATLLEDKDKVANTVTIESDRFSTYVIVYRDGAAGGTGTQPPKTGDENPLLWALMFMGTAAGMSVLLLSQRGKKAHKHLK